MAYTVIAGAVRARKSNRFGIPLRKIPPRGSSPFALWMCRSGLSQPELEQNSVGSQSPHAHETLMLTTRRGNMRELDQPRSAQTCVVLSITTLSLPLLSFLIVPLAWTDIDMNARIAVGTAIREVCNYLSLLPATVTSEEPTGSYPVHPEYTRQRLRSLASGHRSFFFFHFSSSSPSLIKDWTVFDRAQIPTTAYSQIAILIPVHQSRIPKINIDV